ncbi:hypothetical protein FPOAC2_04475 [Fusarium poae]
MSRHLCSLSTECQLSISTSVTNKKSLLLSHNKAYRIPKRASIPSPTIFGISGEKRGGAEKQTTRSASRLYIKYQPPRPSMLHKKAYETRMPLNLTGLHVTRGEKGR